MRLPSVFVLLCFPGQLSWAAGYAVQSLALQEDYKSTWID